MFTHLHVHTEYSLLDGFCRIPQLINRAKELGLTSLAITDHGSMYGTVEFYTAALDAGLKPIIGCELYVAPANRQSRTPAEKSPNHLVILAKDAEGYRNLLQLATRAHLEGFYYKPRIDRELISRYHDGLIALSGCAHGEVARLILEGRLQEARETALWYRGIFGPDYYLEIQRHPIPELEPINQALVELSRDTGIPLVATNDVHYILREDAEWHDLLLCIQTNATVNDEKRLRMTGDSFYLKSPDEMRELFADLPDAIENAGRIADQCNLALEFGRLHLPEIDLPEGKTADEHLADLCKEGVQRRYPNPSPEVLARLEYELDVVRKTSFAQYFLVVWDIVRFTRGQGIVVGVRGSAAASVILYCLGITDVDPLAHRLVFERFLNIERKEMPDIDLDFQDDRREEVISYVTQKFGQDRVAQIITFGTLGARAALRDVGRALGMPYSQVDQVVRYVPLGPGVTLEKALAENPEFKLVYDQDATVRKLVDSAMRLEGVSRHASTHAAGIIISRDPLIDHVPLQQVSRGEDTMAMVQFTMEAVARVGLLKLDLLGLSNLTILARVREIIAARTGKQVDLVNIPLDDAKTYEMLSAGETSGVFQLEGGGMRRYLKELKPAKFSDIAAMVALYRPGPKEHIPTFIRAKEGIEPIRYPHPALADILSETYGVIVYQDQVLFIVQTFAGYSLGEADIVRKAMGKKVAEIMKRERAKFLEGAQKKKGFSAEMAEAVFDLIEPFAGYAFNKAHSVSYAMIAYQTAYLKANYGLEYMTALLDVYADQQDKVATAIAECTRLGLKVLPPDVNRSGASFCIEEGQKAIRFGLADIKNVGAHAIMPIIEERERSGPYKNIEDFCRRVDLRGVNKRVMESLVKAGALDCLAGRGGLLDQIDRVLQFSQQEHRLKESGQSSMFDLLTQKTDDSDSASTLQLTDVDLPREERLAWEKDLLGVYLSEHPLSGLAYDNSEVTAYCGDIGMDMAGEEVILAGMVRSVRQASSKNGRAFVSAVFEDRTGSLPVTCWADAYERSKDLWTENGLLTMRGKVRVRQDEVQIVCDEAWPVGSPAAPTGSPRPSGNGQRRQRRLLITLWQTGNDKADTEQFELLLDVLREFPGQDPVIIRVATCGSSADIEMPNTAVAYGPELRRRLVGMVGEAGLTVNGD